MFSDWIIIGALVVLAAVVVLLFRSGIGDMPITTPRPRSSSDPQGKTSN